MTPRIQDHLISDDLLQEFAAPDYAATLGEFDDATRATLAIALPEIARELLARRAASLTLAVHQNAAEQSLDRARRTLRAPYPVHHRTLTIACQTLLAHSTDAGERMAATTVMQQMHGAA